MYISNLKKIELKFQVFFLTNKIWKNKKSLFLRQEIFKIKK